MVGIPISVLGHFDSSALPEDAQKPVQRWNSLKLRANTSIQLYSDAPMEISSGQISHNLPSDLRIHFTTPVLVTAPKDLTIWTTLPLGPEFTKGWSKLPDELKVLVLSFNLVFRQRIYQYSLPNAFLPYLRITPEIARLAKQVYYSDNIFRVPYKIPANCPFATLLRHLELEAAPTPQSFSALQSTAERCASLPDLKSIRIVFRCLGMYDDQGRLATAELGYVAHFKNTFTTNTASQCNGEVVVGDVSKIRPLDRNWDGDIQGLKSLITSKFTFKKNDNGQLPRDIDELASPVPNSASFLL
ncbi:hypothetical protein BDV95DRAFT_603106 [Massariosphaeria phaeospora]|uniref:Uncharacterized protein n=1 Tax=Massariosphaeria phaeospora TaxID=100035 RepID=A0A7C8IBS0_9PLEO|nr:hypothetical protein BDV95DRAFT_603106 [Massariosphaeria phaeospora]